MNWIFGLLIYYLRYFVGWGSFGRHGAYPIDEFARETQRVWTEADRDVNTNSRVAPEVDFVSAAVPVEGAVNYNEMKWDTFTSITETPEQFAFYNGKSIALVIRKSRFKDHLELLTLRRVIRRHVANNELLND
jgi:hypothetical protein